LLPLNLSKPPTVTGIISVQVSGFLFRCPDKSNKENFMPSSKLYVGNLNYAVTDDQLTELFAAYGTVVQVNIIPGKGFGFVEMSNASEADAAKAGLNNTEFVGRTLRVDEARPPKPRSDRGPGGGGGGQERRWDRRPDPRGDRGGGDRRRQERRW
jgi:RNA recognition motif-containing protein